MRSTCGSASGVSQRIVQLCPSTAHYPFQSFWDSCFHAITLSHIDVGLAEIELRCLLQGQRADGFIPHMLLWETAENSLCDTVSASTITRLRASAAARRYRAPEVHKVRRHPNPASLRRSRRYARPGRVRPNRHVPVSLKTSARCRASSPDQSSDDRPK